MHIVSVGNKKEKKKNNKRKDYLYERLYLLVVLNWNEVLVSAFDIPSRKIPCHNCVVAHSALRVRLQRHDRRGGLRLAAHVERVLGDVDFWERAAVSKVL